MAYPVKIGLTEQGIGPRPLRLMSATLNLEVEETPDGIDAIRSYQLLSELRDLIGRCNFACASDIQLKIHFAYRPEGILTTTDSEQLTIKASTEIDFYKVSNEA